MKIGIIGAMALEVETLKSKMEGAESTTRSGMEFVEGRLGGCPAVVVQSGVGKVNAGICAQILLDCFGVTAILNTGVAGSLDASLDIGDLVISRDAMYHDFDCSAVGYTPGQVPGLPVLAFPADPFLMAKAAEACEALEIPYQVGRIASGDLFVCEKTQKERIIAVTGAKCTEMEGAAIAQAAFRGGVPFLILRAISDKADESAEMDYPAFEKAAAQKCAGLTLYLLEHI